MSKDRKIRVLTAEIVRLLIELDNAQIIAQEWQKEYQQARPYQEDGHLAAEAGARYYTGPV